MKVCPPVIVIVPVLVAPVVFGATEKLTCPFPGPGEGLGKVIQGKVVDAVQAQPLPDVTEKVPFPPPPEKP